MGVVEIGGRRVAVDNAQGRAKVPKRDAVVTVGSLDRDLVRVRVDPAEARSGLATADNVGGREDAVVQLFEARLDFVLAVHGGSPFEKKQSSQGGTAWAQYLPVPGEPGMDGTQKTSERETERRCE